MTSPDGRPESELVEAAQTAASWVRARRATWTNAPLPMPSPRAARVEPPRVFDDEPDVADKPPPATTPPPPPSPLAVEPSSVNAATIARWVGIAAAAGVVLAVIAAGVQYARRAASSFTLPTKTTTAKAETSPSRTPTSTPPSTAKPAPPAPGTGSLHITSTPDRARVSVDGADRGLTPLTVTNLKPGTHTVTISAGDGTVQRSVAVGAGKVVDVDELVFPGWVAVLAPFSVEISEGGRALRPDERNQILLPAGVHELRMTNASLNYSTVQRVEIKSGATTPIRITPGPSALTVTASEAWEVWLDGTRLGETPIHGAAAPLGTHEVVAKRAFGGEKHVTVTIGTAPITVNLDSVR